MLNNVFKLKHKFYKLAFKWIVIKPVIEVHKV